MESHGKRFGNKRSQWAVRKNAGQQMDTLQGDYGSRLARTTPMI